MSERERRYRYAIPRPRSPTFNPARATTDSFPSFYNGGDLPPMSTTSLFDMMTPRGQTADYRPQAIPSSTTHHTTYVVSDSAAARREGLRPRSSSHREHGRSHRSHSDAASRPIIVTTTTKRPEAPSSHTSSTARPGSPTRDAYRSSDDGGSYYSQPASSLRPRSRQSYGGHHHPPYSAGLDNEEYRRQRDRQTGEDRYGHSRHDSHRTPRPMSVYASMPPCKTSAPIDYDNGDVEYTNPGQLARYDLEHSRPEPRRRESLDRYHRPSSSISSDIGGRSFQESSRRGPPPTTWGLDKISQSVSSGLYDQPRVPISPLTSGVPRELQSRRLSGNLDVPNSPLRLRSNSRTRPVSLYQEEERRPSPPDQHPNHHHHRGRGREDEQHVRRESRDRDHGRDAYTTPQSAIEQRGFGVVVDGKPVELHRREESRDRHRERDRDRYRDDDVDRLSDERRRERRERRNQYHGEPKRPSDDSLDRVIIRETERRPEKDDHKNRKDSPRREDDIKDGRSKDDRSSKDEKQVKEKKSDGSVDASSQEPKRLRDTVAAGLSLAAASIGISSVLKDKEKDSESSKADKVVTVEKVGGDDRGSSRRRESVSAGTPPRPLDVAEPRVAVREKPAPVVVESKPKPVTVHDEWEMVDRPSEHRRKPSPESMPVPHTHERSQPESNGRLRDDSADRIVLVERPGETARASKSSHEPAADKDIEKKPAALPSSSTAEDQNPLRRFSRRARGEAGGAAFRPTDTADLVALKAQLAAQDTSTRETEKVAANPPAEVNPQPAQSTAPPPPPPPKDTPLHREPSLERRRASARDTSQERRRPRENSPARRSSPPSQRDDDVEFMDQSGSVVQQRDKNAGGSFDSTSSRGRELVGPNDEKSVRVVSPPREKDDKKPLKGILKPSSKFPEPENFVREGVAPHKDDKTKKDVPAGARWTKIARKLVNPEALTIGKERFEVRDDSVIVLRVLSREEIEAYTVATAQLRGMQCGAHQNW